MPTKEFYDAHSNFAGRTLSEYYLSPGINCKFTRILEHVGTRAFTRALDVGCSGDSLLPFLDLVEYKNFLDLAHQPLVQYRNFARAGPVCGDLNHLPYPDGTFDLVTGLDVLEHMKDDQTALVEMTRVLAPRGILLLTVPHRMKFFTPQDTLVGHYRRYEYESLKARVEALGLRELTKFGVYGQMMKIQVVQQANPDATEEGLNQLRVNYETNPVFKKCWDLVVKVGSKLMQLDAKYQKLGKIMDLCLVFKKK